MCLFRPTIASLNQWNWDGDRIIFDSVVPSSRRPIGRTRGKAYDIDVREFLVSEKNAVTKRVLSVALPAYLKEKGINADVLTKRTPGAFDMRAHLIASYVAATVGYSPSDGRDPWQFPEETLALGTGDCEDIAFLLASLLLACGISGYNIRVALGKIHTETAVNGKKHFDHMWVMYKCEAGHWLLLEPLRLDPYRPAPARTTRRTTKAAGTPPPGGIVAYHPYFLFNTDHLWQVDGHDNGPTFQDTVQKRWTKIHPRFAGQVHQTILHDALGSVAPQYVKDALDRHFSRIAGIGPTVDDVDNFVTHGYDSRDHFDNAFIAEGWQRVQARLADFAQDNTNMDAFAYAAHAIADFYAHSSYLHFAKVSGGTALPYDPAHPTDGLRATPHYGPGSDFDFVNGPFTLNSKIFSGSKADAATAWDGQLVSGRYAQKGDSHGLIETLTVIPKDLQKTPGFALRGGLPHHNEIAVDDSPFDKKHKLYQDLPNPAPTNRLAYTNQFNWRKQTAVKHIRQAFVQCWKG